MLLLLLMLIKLVAESWLPCLLNMNHAHRNRSFSNLIFFLFTLPIFNIAKIGAQMQLLYPCKILNCIYLFMKYILVRTVYQNSCEK